mmetsp:Transcript_31564/g.97618  ORF Transcript_31564/g.97618 Transcript_31564/m.97618 type:complete len:241 (-) Transcript_31564:11-733(-)
MLKSSLTSKKNRSAGKLGDAGFDEETIELIVSLKHHLKRAAKLDVVFDAIECKRRDDVKQYFRMADDELALIRKAGSRDILVAMDAQRRATNPDITNCAPNLTFDGEPVTAFFYSLSKDDVRRLVAHPLTQDQGLSFGDAVFSLEMLKGAVSAKVSSYRAHLRPADFAKVFTAEGSFGDARKSEDAKVAELRASTLSLGDDDDAAAKGDVVEKNGAGIDLLGYDADAGKHVAPALPSHYV